MYTRMARAFSVAKEGTKSLPRVALSFSRVCPEKGKLWRGQDNVVLKQRVQIDVRLYRTISTLDIPLLWEHGPVLVDGGNDRYRPIFFQRAVDCIDQAIPRGYEVADIVTLCHALRDRLAATMPNIFAEVDPYWSEVKLEYPYRITATAQGPLD